MKKMLLITFGVLLINNYSLVLGYVISLTNHTPYKVELFAHTNDFGCCKDSNCGAEGNCKVTLNGKTTSATKGEHTLKSGTLGRNCQKACWSCVIARIYVNGPNKQPIEKKYELNKGPITLYNNNDERSSNIGKLANPSPSFIASFKGYDYVEDEKYKNGICKSIDLILFGNGKTPADFLLGIFPEILDPVSLK